jgi:hypothetical protein
MSSRPVAWDVVEREARLPQEALPDVDVVGRAADRQAVNRLLSSLRIEQRHALEGIRVEQVRKVADRLREGHKPVVERPFRDVLRVVDAVGEVRRLPALERRQNLSRMPL